MTGDLFPSSPGRQSPAPLADRMRPRSFDELVGQSHLFEPGAPLAVMRDGRHLASASWGEVLVWDVQAREKVQALGSHAGAVWSVAFSPDGQRLAAAGGYKGKGEIKIWDAALWTRKPAQP